MFNEVKKLETENEVKKFETEDEARFWHNSLREQITQENNLLDQRLTWLIQGQGLLFAALAFAWGETTLVIFLSVIGIFMSLSIWTAIAMHSPTVLKLNNFWKSHRPDSWKDYPLAGRSEPAKPPMKYFRPWRAVPVIFCSAWIFILFYTLS